MINLLDLGVGNLYNYYRKVKGSSWQKSCERRLFVISTSRYELVAGIMKVYESFGKTFTA